MYYELLIMNELLETIISIKLFPKGVDKIICKYTYTKLDEIHKILSEEIIEFIMSFTYNTYQYQTKENCDYITALLKNRDFYDRFEGCKYTKHNILIFACYLMFRNKYKEIELRYIDFFLWNTYWHGHSGYSIIFRHNENEDCFIIHDSEYVIAKYTEMDK